MNDAIRSRAWSEEMVTILSSGTVKEANLKARILGAARKFKDKYKDHMFGDAYQAARAQVGKAKEKGPGLVDDAIKGVKKVEEGAKAVSGAIRESRGAVQEIKGLGESARKAFGKKKTLADRWKSLSDKQKLMVGGGAGATSLGAIALGSSKDPAPPNVYKLASDHKFVERVDGMVLSVLADLLEGETR